MRVPDARACPLAPAVESTGLAGRVQCSGATQALADEAASAGGALFVWLPRSQVAVKGKGALSTVLVQRTAQGVVPPAGADTLEDCGSGSGSGSCGSGSESAS
jgi:hypothetical protein